MGNGNGHGSNGGSGVGSSNNDLHLMHRRPLQAPAATLRNPPRVIAQNGTVIAVDKLRCWERALRLPFHYELRGERT